MGLPELHAQEAGPGFRGWAALSMCIQNGSSHKKFTAPGKKDLPAIGTDLVLSWKPPKRINCLFQATIRCPLRPEGPPGDLKFKKKNKKHFLDQFLFHKHLLSTT